jgi:serine/threonine-protein kinase RsbW
MAAAPPLRVAARLENLSGVREFVRSTAAGLAVDPDTVTDVLLAVDEAVTNIIVHGYRGCGGIIELSVKRTDEALVVRLRDECDPFDPCCVAPPDLGVPLEQRRPGGLGIHLMRHMVDEVHHRTTGEGGNELTLVKRLRPVQS